MIPLWVRVDVGAMAMKEYSAFPKAPILLESHHQIVWCHIQDTDYEGVLLLCRDAICLYNKAPADWARCIECQNCYSYVNNRMGKTEELSIDLRQRFINFYKSGKSNNTFSNKLAYLRSTVLSVIKKFKQFGTIISLSIKENFNCHW